MKITVSMDSKRVVGDVFGFHVEIIAREADSEIEALEAVRRTVKMIAGGRRTFFRYYPESNSERNFDTKITDHRAYSRFVVLDEPGEWEAPAMTINIPSIGEAIERGHLRRRGGEAPKSEPAGEPSAGEG